MDISQEAAYFYEFVYTMEGIKQPFDEWLPDFMDHLEKVLKGEEVNKSIWTCRVSYHV